MSETKQRIDVRIPKTLLEKVDNYKSDEGIGTRSAAVFELIRLGLETVEKRKDEKQLYTRQL